MFMFVLSFHLYSMAVKDGCPMLTLGCKASDKGGGGRTGLVVRASDSGSGDPCSFLGRVGVLFP